MPCADASLYVHSKRAKGWYQSSGMPMTEAQGIGQSDTDNEAVNTWAHRKKDKVSAVP